MVILGAWKLRQAPSTKLVCLFSKAHVTICLGSRSRIIKQKPKLSKLPNLTEKGSVLMDYKKKKPPRDLFNKQIENEKYKTFKNQIDSSKQISYPQKHSEGNLRGLFCLSAGGGPKDWQTWLMLPMVLPQHLLLTVKNLTAFGILHHHICNARKPLKGVLGCNGKTSTANFWLCRLQTPSTPQDECMMMQTKSNPKVKKRLKQYQLLHKLSTFRLQDIAIWLRYVPSCHHPISFESSNHAWGVSNLEPNAAIMPYRHDSKKDFPSQGPCAAMPPTNGLTSMKHLLLSHNYERSSVCFFEGAFFVAGQWTTIFYSCNLLNIDPGETKTDVSPNIFQHFFLSLG